MDITAGATGAWRTGLALAAEGSPGPADPGFTVPLWAWGTFVAFIVALLIVDLKVVMGDEHEIQTREAAWYSAAWISLGVLFGAFIWVWQGGDSALLYITGYLIEKSLSIDNVFVWAVMFQFFAVPPKYQHRVLFWGIFGALVLRAVFIFSGTALIENFAWIVYVFGAFLLYTAYRIARSDEIEVDPENNPVLKRVRMVLPQTDEYHGQRFFVTVDGRRMVTPLLTVLVSIEFTDVLFAVDSVPAILAITTNEFLVFSSNAFAILGLRALYFLLAGIQDKFFYLNKGLGVILGFVGIKFILEGFGLHIPIWFSLGFIALVLTLTIWLSLRHADKAKPPELERAEAAEPQPEAAAGQHAAKEEPDAPQAAPRGRAADE